MQLWNDADAELQPQVAEISARGERGGAGGVWVRTPNVVARREASRHTSTTPIELPSVPKKP